MFPTNVIEKTLVLALWSIGISLVLGESVGLAATTTLIGTVRDFKRGDQAGGHPDFEDPLMPLGLDPGIVEETLGMDGKPVYASETDTHTTHGAMFFDQWYRDVMMDVNLSIPFAITLDDSANPGEFTFGEIEDFFPIDNQLFGNQAFEHNLHFTFETHTEFTFSAGQFFQVGADDDCWVFIDGQLVIDLGGIHGFAIDAVQLNSLGLTVGQTYDFDLFFAERRSGGSILEIHTSIEFPILPGDYNVNGIVDTADYTVWRDALGRAAALPNEGATPNIVDSADYDVWKMNFGQTDGSGSASTIEGLGVTPVPEPTTFGLAMFVVVVQLCCPALRRARTFHGRKGMSDGSPTFRAFFGGRTSAFDVGSVSPLH